MEVDQNFDKICRACLSESSNMKSLFAKLEGGQQLLDLLVVTANIEVRSADTLPKQVCGDCESFLYQADDFKRRCKESEMILKNICPSGFNPYSVKTDEDTEGNEAKISISCLEKPNNCEVVIEKPDFLSLFANSDISLKKLDSTKIDEKHTVKTEVGLEFDNVDYEDHFNGNEELLIPIEIEGMKEVTTYKCVCGEEYKSKDKFKDHIKLKNCAKKHSKKDSNKTCIPIKNKIECLKCNLTFDTINKWSTHQLIHTKEFKKVFKRDNGEAPKLQCSLCLRKFKSKITLRKHLKRHEAKDSIKHVCSKCKREFKYKAYLESHMLSVHLNGNNSVIFYLVAALFCC